jgi:hypothetical protein
MNRQYQQLLGCSLQVLTWYCATVGRKFIKFSKGLGATSSSPTGCVTRGVEAGKIRRITISIIHVDESSFSHSDKTLTTVNIYNHFFQITIRVLKNISSSIIALVTEEGKQFHNMESKNILELAYSWFTSCDGGVQGLIIWTSGLQPRRIQTGW